AVSSLWPCYDTCDTRPEAVLVSSTQNIRQFAQIANLVSWRWPAGIWTLAFAINPHNGYSKSGTRNDIVKITLCGVKQTLARKAGDRLIEMCESWFIRPDLLRRDYQIELDGEMASCCREEIIIDVRENPELELAGQSLKRRVRVRERFPLRQTLS